MYAVIPAVLLSFLILISQVTAGCCGNIKQVDTDAVKRINSAHQASSSDSSGDSSDDSSSIPAGGPGLRFVGCIPEQSKRIKKITSIANKMLDHARLTLVDSKSEAYTTWFGAAEQSYYDTVVEVFQGTGKADRFTYDCATCALQYPEDDSMDTYAQMTKDPSRHIYLCEKFWETEPVGFGSQASLVVRSLVQFAGGGEITNNPVNRKEAKDLANSKPIEAIKNANNYKYFAETYFATGPGSKDFFDHLKELKIHKEMPAGGFEHTVHRVG
ncbi:peptidyl-lys metalloendopeptidase, partial [Rhizoctonia solani AG-3 Rhs1AP]